MATILIYKDGVLTSAERDSTGDYTLDVQPVEQSAVQQTAVFFNLFDDTYYASNDTNITISDVYNKILLTCNLEEIEDLISSPLTEEDMYSPALNYQKYCTELISEGEGDTAINAFRNMVYGNSTSYDGAHQIDWFIRTYKSNNWTFNSDNFVSDSGNYQAEVMKHLASTPGLCALVELGQIEKPDAQDNTLESSVNMTKYLVISVNGNGDHSETGHYPTETQLQAASPAAVYTGNMSGGLFSPVDSETTNYIVLSGDIVMNARTQLTDTWWRCYNVHAQYFKNRFWHKTWRNPKLSDNDDGAYYSVKWFDNPNPSSADVPRRTYTDSLRPYNSDFSPEEFKYSYSARGSSEDKLLKLPVLACRLKIGNKYCIEDYDVDGSSYYTWVNENEVPTMTDEDGIVYRQDFLTIGPNPAIDDFIIGKSYSLANNITPAMNIDADGIAIPIKQSDKLTGKVEFEILGPINTTWNEITRRHATWFRSEKWYENIKYLLASTGAIYVKDFEITVHTDNGKINTQNNDNDLVYFSDESTKFINIKDDIEFNISTALTSQECLAKGVKQSLKLNNPILKSSGLPLRSVYNTITQEAGKPEEHYINNYYLASSAPKVLIETTAWEKEYDNLYTHFQFNQFIDKDFYIAGFEMDLKKDKIKYNLREI